jgi:hypothetical protein
VEESEDEGWNGGLPRFPGLLSWRSNHSDFRDEEDKVEEEKMGEDHNEEVHISDEEDYLVIAPCNTDSEKELDLDEDSVIDAKLGIEPRPEAKIIEDSISRSEPSSQNGPLRISEGGEGIKVNLLCDYDENGDDSDDEPPEEVKIVKCMDDTVASSPSVSQHHDLQPDKQTEVKIGRSRHRKRKPNNQADKKEHTGGPTMPVKVARPDVLNRPIRPPTLLEKLLLDEIKRERNVVLQCVRYVCDQNFFLS